jgi:thrombospondin type 3 repeat protein
MSVLLRRVGLGLVLLLSVAGRVWAQHDLDVDGLLDDFDNCIYHANVDQRDRDGDNTGDVCDNCPDAFNAGQSDIDGNGIGDVCDVNPPTRLTLTSVRLKASRPNASTGSIVVKGVLDTTQLGGLKGLSDALRLGLAVSVSGAGLPSPETVYFPPCVTIVSCSATGTLPAHPVHRVIDAGSPRALISFVRKGNTNLFTTKVTIQERSFAPPLTAAGATVALSVGTFSFGTLYFGGVDQLAQLSNCRASGKGKSVSCRK